MTFFSFLLKEVLSGGKPVDDLVEAISSPNCRGELWHPPPPKRELFERAVSSGKGRGIEDLFFPSLFSRRK